MVAIKFVLFDKASAVCLSQPLRLAGQSLRGATPATASPVVLDIWDSTVAGRKDLSPRRGVVLAQATPKARRMRTNLSQMLLQKLSWTAMI